LITAADYTGDGDLLAIGNNGTLYRYNGLGDGTFGSATAIGPGWSTYRTIT
jgi:hypothetical protein